MFLVNLARVVFAPLLQPVAADFGVSTASLGVIATAAWLGSALPRIPTGLVMTRVPRHYIVITTGSFLVVTAAFTGLAGSPAHLGVGAFLMGLSSGMYFIAANPLVSELFPDRIGRAIGIHGMFNQLAAVTAPLLVGGILLVADWRTTFLAISGAAAVTTVAIVTATHRADVPEAGAEDRSLLAAARAHWPLILTGICVIGMMGFLWNGLFNLYGDYLEATKGIEPATGRLLLSLMFAAGLPAWVLMGRLADRVRNVPLMVAILLGFVVAVLALTVAQGLGVIALASVLVGYLYFSLPPVLDTYLLGRLPDRHRGSAYTWFSATMMIITATGAGAIGAAVDAGVAYDLTFRLLTVVIATVAVALAVTYRLGRLGPGPTGA